MVGRREVLPQQMTLSTASDSTQALPNILEVDHQDSFSSTRLRGKYGRMEVGEDADGQVITVHFNFRYYGGADQYRQSPALYSYERPGGSTFKASRHKVARWYIPFDHHESLSKTADRLRGTYRRFMSVGGSAGKSVHPDEHGSPQLMAYDPKETKNTPKGRKRRNSEMSVLAQQTNDHYDEDEVDSSVQMTKHFRKEKPDHQRVLAAADDREGPTRACFACKINDFECDGRQICRNCKERETDCDYD